MTREIESSEGGYQNNPKSKKKGIEHLSDKHKNIIEKFVAATNSAMSIIDADYNSFDKGKKQPAA